MVPKISAASLRIAAEYNMRKYQRLQECAPRRFFAQSGLLT